MNAISSFESSGLLNEPLGGCYVLLLKCTNGEMYVHNKPKQKVKYAMHIHDKKLKSWEPGRPHAIGLWLMKRQL